MKLKDCKIWNKHILHSLVLCERFGKNLLGPLNLNIYLISWINFSTKSHGLSLDKGSLWVTVLKKVQIQRESTPQNITGTINCLSMVEWLRLSSGDQFQNKEYYKTEIEVLGHSWIFCQMKEMLSLRLSLLIAPTHFHTIYAVLVLTFLYGFHCISFRFPIYWPKPFSQQIKFSLLLD